MESVPHLSSHDGPGRVQADGLLAADVVAYADGGGHTQTFTPPVYGRERIARLVPGFETWLQLPAPRRCGWPRSTVAIRAISDPEKLCHLDPMARRPGPLAR
jgi:hypothetical protein